MENYNKRTQVLVEAIPYIQRYVGKTFVIKFGGNAMTTEKVIEEVIKDVVFLQLLGINVVFVHGGGPEIEKVLNKIGKKSEFIEGLRVTDEETMDVVQMVLAGKINKDIVHRIQNSGGKAVGLCGFDGNMLIAKKLGDGKLGQVGEIQQVNLEILQDCFEKGYIPVVSSVAAGENGEVYNINADFAASKIAGKLKAEKLILMTNVMGLLEDEHKPETLISVVKTSEVARLKKDGIIKGGMIPKMDCCVDAVRQGVKKAHIINGLLLNSLLVEIFSDDGIGTMII